jgi:hypothetical protein
MVRDVQILVAQTSPELKAIAEEHVRMLKAPLLKD